MGTPLGPKYIPYTYMDPLGTQAPKKLRGSRGLNVAIMILGSCDFGLPL